MTTHNMRHTPEYSAWRRMKTACYNKNSRQYGKYGQVGIRVCGEWKENFLKFYEDMGPMGDDANGLQLLDPTKDFGKYNCKWAWNDSGRTRKAKAKLKRSKPANSPYKRLTNPRTLCLVVEDGLLEFIKKQAMHKSLEEGYLITVNDMIRDVLARQFPRNSQRDLFGS